MYHGSLDWKWAGWALALASTACGNDVSTATQGGAVTGADRRGLIDRPVLLGPLIPRLTPTPTASDSTVPANGDVNPYGVAFVPSTFPTDGALHGGDVIVSNFNNAGNLQGTGTTIVRVRDGESPVVFFQDASTPGLSTALAVLQRGYVLVGNVPSTNGAGVCAGSSGSGADAGAGGEEEDVGNGAILVIDARGKLVERLRSAALLAGPWDSTLVDEGSRAQLYVSNALSGGVTRVDLQIGAGDDGRAVQVASMTQIASGYDHRCDPAAFVVGPAGLAYDREADRLYVASTGDNGIYAIDRASRIVADQGLGRLVIRDEVHLHGPLGLILAPNGHLLSAQGDAVNPDPSRPSEIVELTRSGEFVAEFSIDPAAGSAFGLAIEAWDGHFRFAAVDDGLNVLDVWDAK